MGDTGSMFFGGIVTALAFVMQRPELVLFFRHCLHLGRDDRRHPAHVF